MAGIDDDLMDGGIIIPSQNNQNASPQKEQACDCPAPPQRGRGVDLLFQIIHYLIDAAMILLSGVMMDYEKAYPLVFCIGLIIWMAYRILYFKRSKTIDIIIGLFLFVAAVVFYVFSLIGYNDYYRDAEVGWLLIATVYLGFFCVWGAIRRNRNANEENDK